MESPFDKCLAPNEYYIADPPNIVIPCTHRWAHGTFGYGWFSLYVEIGGNTYEIRINNVEHKTPDYDIYLYDGAITMNMSKSEQELLLAALDHPNIPTYAELIEWTSRSISVVK